MRAWAPRSVERFPFQGTRLRAGLVEACVGPAPIAGLGRIGCGTNACLVAECPCADTTPSHSRGAGEGDSHAIGALL